MDEERFGDLGRSLMASSEVSVVKGSNGRGESFSSVCSGTNEGVGVVVEAGPGFGDSPAAGKGGIQMDLRRWPEETGCWSSSGVLC